MKEGQQKGCVEGCHCEEEQREEFPDLRPPIEEQSSNLKAMWGHGKGQGGSLAKDNMEMEKPAPGQYGNAMWGHGKSQEGSLAEGGTEVKKSSPESAEAAMWGHEGSLAKAKRRPWIRAMRNKNQAAEE